MSTSSKKTLFLTRFSLLLALEAIVCFTPLGSIPITPAIVATLMMLPVIVAAIVMGPKAGTAMGAFAGLFSLLVWTFVPPGPAAFVFSPFHAVDGGSGSLWSLVIVFLPRILGGTVAGLLFRAMEPRLAGGRIAFAYGLAGLAGSMVNTLGVLGCIYLFFGPAYAEAYGMAFEVLLGAIGLVILTNGVPEAVICTLVAMLVCHPLRRMTRLVEPNRA